MRVAVANSNLKHDALILAGLAVILVIAGLGLSNQFHRSIIILSMIYGIAAIGLTLLMGYAGQVSIGQGAFMGVGAYTAAFAVQRFGLPVPIALVAATVLPGLLGYVIARPILRLSGHNLALGTLALGAVFFVVAAQWRSVTGGIDPGIVNSAKPWHSGPKPRDCPLLAGGNHAAAGGRRGGEPGRRALRPWARGVAYIRGGGGLHGRRHGAREVDGLRDRGRAGRGIWRASGALSTVVQRQCLRRQSVDRAVDDGHHRIMSTIWGAIFGAFAIIVLPNLLEGFEEAKLLVYGLTMVGVMMFAPRGLGETLFRLVTRSRTTS